MIKVYELMQMLSEMPAGADVLVGGCINLQDLAQCNEIETGLFDTIKPAEDCYCEDNICKIVF